MPGVTPELAGAVERAMALDPADRPASAEELRRALLDGARGVGAGPTTATRAVPRQDDAATSIAAPVGAVGPATPTAPVRRAPREAPSASRREAQPAAAPAAGTARARDRDRPRRRSGLRRLAALLLLLLLVGGGAVAAVVASSNDGRAVHLRRVAYDDVQRSDRRDAAARPRQHALAPAAPARRPRPARPRAPRGDSAASVPVPIASRSRRTRRSTKARLWSVSRRITVVSRARAR